MPGKLIEIGIYLNQEFGNASGNKRVVDSSGDTNAQTVDAELKGYVRTFRE